MALSLYGVAVAQAVDESQGQGGDFASSDGIVSFWLSKALTNLVKTFTSKVRAEGWRRVYLLTVSVLFLCWCRVGRNVEIMVELELVDVVWMMNGWLGGWCWIPAATGYNPRYPLSAFNPTPPLPLHAATPQMSTFSTAPIVIDGKGHLLGRLASIIAKQVSQLSWNGKNGSIRKYPLCYEHVGNRGLYQNPLA
jgi:hypothetical protein